MSAVISRLTDRLCVWTACVGVAALPVSAAEPAQGKDADKGGTDTVDIDAEYVKEHLKEYLKPTRISFENDGSVKMVFEFHKKTPEHEAVFTPEIKKGARNTFRWTVRGEDYYSGYYDDDDDGTYSWGGIKIANQGMAVLNCWFLSDVKAEAEYRAHNNYSRRQRVALMYYTDKHLGVGANFGDQCLTLKKTKARPLSGEVEPVLIRSKMKIGLAVKDGNVDVFKDGRKKASSTYKEKNFTSGRIGFHWGGTVTGVFRSLEITGKLDNKRMAEEIRKKNKRRK